MGLEDFRAAGLFSTAEAVTGDEIDETDAELIRLREAGDWVAFFRLAVERRRNILISGATGSGKTTFAKGLVELIPGHERLLTIEDTRELVLPQRNVVHLLYSKDGQGLAKVGPKPCWKAPCACVRTGSSFRSFATERHSSSFAM